MYDSDLAHVWDLIYCDGREKAYAEESIAIEKLVRAEVPAAAALLDVGCGTGEHLVTWAGTFEHVAGVDLSPAMVDQAAAKLPGIPLHVADMCDLALGRRYDAVVSMYSAVGYLPDLDALHRAIARLADHLAPGGVLLVEPWWFADRFIDGYVGAEVVRSRGRTVTRTSRTVRGADGRAHMDIHYVVADWSGLRHFTEQHRFGLWRQYEYEDAFRAAGLTVEYRRDELECGLFVARPQKSA